MLKNIPTFNKFPVVLEEQEQEKVNPQYANKQQK